MKGRTKLVKALSLLCALCLVCLVGSVPLPVKAQGYTYTVRFFVGTQGSINEKGSLNGGRVSEDMQMLVFENLQYGQQVIFNQNMITLNDGSKYYIRGLRESGKDNNTVGGYPSFTVTGDQDYVVAYGILGSAVAYTVNYVDQNGGALAPSETYYGNVGDKAVIAYLYIDGYQPQAYNIGLTLSENAADNVIDFIYTRIPETSLPPIVPPEAGTGGYTDEGTTLVDGGTVVQGAGTNFDDLNGGGAGGAGAGGGDAENISDNDVPLELPDEYLDLDENQTPAGNFPGGPGNDGLDGPGIGDKELLRLEIGALTLPITVRVMVVIVCSLVIILCASVVLAQQLKRKKADE